MKNQYINNLKPKATGYQDFPNLYALLGKIEFWKAIGITLDNDKLNGLFHDEFGKEMNYFN